MKIEIILIAILLIAPLVLAQFNEIELLEISPKQIIILILSTCIVHIITSVITLPSLICNVFQSLFLGGSFLFLLVISCCSCLPIILCNSVPGMFSCLSLPIFICSLLVCFPIYLLLSKFIEKEKVIMIFTHLYALYYIITMLYPQISSCASFQSILVISILCCPIIPCILLLGFPCFILSISYSCLLHFIGFLFTPLTTIMFPKIMKFRIDLLMKIQLPEVFKSYIDLASFWFDHLINPTTLFSLCIIPCTILLYALQSMSLPICCLTCIPCFPITICSLLCSFIFQQLPTLFLPLSCSLIPVIVGIIEGDIAQATCLHFYPRMLEKTKEPILE